MNFRQQTTALLLAAMMFTLAPLSVSAAARYTPPAAQTNFGARAGLRASALLEHLILQAA